MIQIVGHNVRVCSSHRSRSSRSSDDDLLVCSSHRELDPDSRGLTRHSRPASSLSWVLWESHESEWACWCVCASLMQDRLPNTGTRGLSRSQGKLRLCRVPVCLPQQPHPDSSLLNPVQIQISAGQNSSRQEDFLCKVIPFTSRLHLLWYCRKVAIFS